MKYFNFCPDLDSSNDFCRNSSAGPKPSLNLGGCFWTKVDFFAYFLGESGHFACFFRESRQFRAHLKENVDFFECFSEKVDSLNPFFLEKLV